MEKISIQNRKNQRVVVIVEKVDEQKGLAFVMHGLSGYKEEKHIERIASSFVQSGYTTVRFDTTNTFGESEGEYEKATVTNYYADLEDVIAWAKTQEWYQAPFVLAGHSLGGVCTALYAENHPELVLALAPISTVVSGALSVDAREARTPGSVAHWKETGWEEELSVSRGTVRRLPWSHMEDRMKYDLLTNVNKLVMPVLMLVGDLDDSTPLYQQRILYEKLPGTKEIHTISGAGHVFREEVHLSEIEQIFLAWIRSLPQAK